MSVLGLYGVFSNVIKTPCKQQSLQGVKESKEKEVKCLSKCHGVQIAPLLFSFKMEQGAIFCNTLFANIQAVEKYTLRFVGNGAIGVQLGLHFYGFICSTSVIIFLNFLIFFAAGL